MAKNQIFRKVLDENGEPLIVDGDFVSELIYEEEVADEIPPPNWKQFKEDLFKTQVFYKAMAMGNPNVYATLLKLITDGEVGYAKEENFVMLFNMLGIEWTIEERAIINQALVNNFFTIQV
jgi:hypothetical protein